MGVFPPSSARADLRRVLPAGLTATPVERWHLTLVFLGEVAPERLGEVELALDGAATAPGIELRLAGAGRFTGGRSTALWVGVEGDLDALHRLRDGLRGALERAGLPSDERPFRPHLTVAYARGGAEAPEVLRSYVGPTWTVAEFVLVRSRHTEGGGGYDALRRWSC